MKLTDTSIKTALREAAQAGKQGRKIFDGRGLYLIPRPNNVGWWRFKYRHRGREKCISLGTYPDVSLKRARDKRDEARSLVAEGTDPSAQRKVDRMAGDFKALANDWLEKKGASLDESTFTIAKQRLERYVFPYIGDKPPKKIEPTDVLHLLRRIEEAGKLETAHRVRQLIGQAFRYGIGLGLADRDPTADLKGVLKTVEVKHMAAITVPAEVGKLLRAIEGYNGQPSSEIALKLLPLIFVRPGELRQATWQEIDLNNALWRIPASRMKMKREHIVPLSKQAIDLLYEIKRVTGKRSYVFESLRRGRPLSENTINGALRALGYDGNTMTAHGFRSTASSLLHELGWPESVIELQLAHSVPGVAGIYNRSARLEERTRMMQAWADYLDSLKQGASVTPIRAEVITS